MFRRLYWIIEQVSANGASIVTGVYTSIPDLLHKGLQGCEKGQTLRITLVKPDTFNAPLGQWSGPGYADIAQDLKAFVDTHEITEEEVLNLTSALSNMATI